MKVELIKRTGLEHAVTVNIKSSAQIAYEGSRVYIGGYIAEHHKEEDASRLYATLITAITKGAETQTVYDTYRTFKAALTDKSF